MQGSMETADGAEEGVVAGGRKKREEAVEPEAWDDKCIICGARRGLSKTTGE